MIYLLGVDIGTSSSKGVMVDLEGNIKSESFFEHEILHPKPGWAEHDPEKHWWKDFVSLTKTLIAKSNIDPKNIVAIGVSGLIPVVCAVDKHGRPVRPAIIYSDTRAINEINYIREKIGIEQLSKICGNQIISSSALPKILWLKRHEPKRFSKVKMILNAHSYIVFKLTGQYSIDPYTSSIEIIYDVERMRLREDICKELGIPTDILPPIHPASKVIGEITPEAARKTKLAKGTPVIVGSGDVVGSMLSVGVVNGGDAMLTYGSTAVIMVCCDERKVHPKLFSGVHVVEPRKYIIGGATTTSGALLKWFRDNFCQIKLEMKQRSRMNSYYKLDNEAKAIPEGSEGIIILPYFMGERTPIYDPLARGLIFGLSLSHTRAHVYRALLESVGYSIRHVIETIKESGVSINRVMSVNGGAKSDLWRQIISDISNISQNYVEKSGGAPRGMAYLAGYGARIFRDFKTLSDKWVKITAVTEPRKKSYKKYNDFYRIYKNLYPALKSHFKELATLLEQNI